jgi:hypothetical protein|tara:strand:+ start:109 stop:375 length:267 start_codon:yes stop_codon:yes gene_type:complete
MYLYCISDGSLCKFGFSIDPARRLKTLQTGNANKLKLIHTVQVDEGVTKLERKLHKEYANLRVHGEWFRATAEEGENMLTWFEIHYIN